MRGDDKRLAAFLSPDGVQHWRERLNWTTYEAALNLETPYRTFMRWHVSGLPHQGGRVIARRMLELEKIHGKRG